MTKQTTQTTEAAVAEFEKKVDSYQGLLEMKDKDIAERDETIASLNGRVESLQHELAAARANDDERMKQFDAISVTLDKIAALFVGTDRAGFIQGCAFETVEAYVQHLEAELAKAKGDQVLVVVERKPAVSFEGKRFGRDAIDAVVAEAPTYILFGDGNASIPELTTIEAHPGSYTLVGERRQYDRDVRIVGGGIPAEGVRIVEFGLAADPEGPVIATCEVPGGILLLPGRTIEFRRGSILF